MKPAFKKVRPGYLTDARIDELLQDVITGESGNRHWRAHYKTLNDAVLRFVWMSPSTFPIERRNCARAIVAGRSAWKPKGRHQKAVRNSKPTADLHIRLDADLIADIEEACAKLDGMTKADFVRLAINNELDNVLGELSDD
jgi:hypothetical protein